MNEGPLRRIFLLLFFLSGFSALLYQVLWFRMLGLIVGGTVAAAVTVLASFMLGLALGARLVAALAHRLARPLRTYALLEAAVAVLALLSPLGLEAARRTYVLLAPDPVDAGGAGPGLVLLRAGLAFLVLLGPTTAMGATLPVLVARFVRRWETAGVRVGSLYAANLWGAVCGTAATGFFVLPLLGLRVGLTLGALVTFATAATAWVVSARVSPPPPAGPVPGEASSTGAGSGPRGGAPAAALGVFALFLVTGWASFVYEVLWTRLLVLHLGSSAYAFSLMLALFLLGLALGGALGGPLADRCRNPLLALGLLEVGVGICLALGLAALPRLPDLLETAALWVAPGGLSFRHVIFSSALAVAPLLLPVTLLIGASFPVGAKVILRDPRLAAARVGRLYAWNTLGNILGALAGGLLLLPLLGARDGMLLAGAVNGLAGALVVGLALGRRSLLSRSLASAGAALVVLGAVGIARHSDVLLAAGVFRQERAQVLHAQETPQGLVTVTRHHREGRVWKSLEVDGVNVAGTSPGLVAIQKLQGHLPLLLHPDPRRVLHIGFGSGGTARAVATHPGVRAIEVAEINPAIPPVAHRWFSEVNQGVLEDPRVQLVLEDGRNVLLATDRTWDVILSDSVHPRYAGNSALYTEDYFRLARSRLAPGGLVSLWLPIYSLSDQSFRMILQSVREVFPHTSVWYVNSTINEFCIVIGRTRGPGLDPARMREALAHEAVARDLRAVGASGAMSILDYLVGQGPDLDPLLRGVPSSRDDRPLVEYLSARVVHRDLSWLTNLELLRRTRKPRWDLLPPGERELRKRWEDLYPSTTANLEGQVWFLRAGLSGLPAGEAVEAREKAALAFDRADRLAPEEDEPWEWFGLPETYPKEWNRAP